MELWSGSNRSEKLPINPPPNCTNLDNWVFENFILVDKSVAKTLRIFKTCVLVNNNLWGKLVSSLELPIKFDGRFKTTSVPIFS